ncbi:MAG TPA: serine/threonine-protein kinase, partial [Candidatus Paceibacterota bacterium]|nr:serine/threonine-protein kinase [Candidatus Paceibacterota bacterium]
MGKLTETQVRGIIPDEYQELDFTSEQGSNGLPLKATCNGKRVFLKALKFTENNKSMIDDEVTALNDLNQLNNPNIAQLNRVLQPSEEYILLEFQLVEGKTLSTILKERKAENKPFTENETYKLAKDICSALSSVNSIDRVHHDVKPANIMFDGENYILLDFGISRLNDHKVNKRSRAIYMYSSPEQLLSWTGLTEGKRDQVTIQSDFFSLGVILYELLTLKYPFGDGSHDIVISEKHLPIKALRPDLSESLSNFVERLLEKRVGDRFLGVSDIADCIKNRSCDVKKKKVEGLIFYGHDHHATGGFLNFLNYRAGAPEHLPDGVRLSTSHFPKSDQVGQLLLSGYSFIVDPEVYFLPHKSKYTKNKLKYVPYNLKTDSYGEKLSNAEKLNQWVESVIDHQLRNNADILLAPSFLTSGTLDGNLLLNSKVIEVTKKIAKEKAPNRPLFVTYILKKDLLTSKDARTFIIGSAGTLEGFDGIYLLCESSVTGGRAPM